VEERNPRVRHGFVLLTKVYGLNPADGFPPQPMWFDAAQVVSVAQSTWEPNSPGWIRSWSDVVLMPPNQPFRVTETAEEVIDLVAQAREPRVRFVLPADIVAASGGLPAPKLNRLGLIIRLLPDQDGEHYHIVSDDQGSGTIMIHRRALGNLKAAIDQIT
jgi:hypothetical protein